MAYPSGHYGEGIRGLGDAATDLYLQSSGGVIPIDSSNPNQSSFAGYLNWAFPGQAGVASNSPSPGATTNQTGSTPSSGGFNQVVSQNSGMITLLAVGLLVFVLLKK